jgi:hypothetical protein
VATLPYLRFIEALKVGKTSRGLLRFEYIQALHKSTGSAVDIVSHLTKKQIKSFQSIFKLF